jgi:hypothetical protein
MGDGRTKRSARRLTFSIAASLIALALGAFVVHAATATHRTETSKRPVGFLILGKVAEPLRPGTSSQVKVYVAAKRNKTLWITAMSMSLKVDAAHQAAGCSADRDFTITQLPKSAFPMKLSPSRKVKRVSKIGSSKSKRKVTVKWRAVSPKRSQGLPAISMRNLSDVNQDACKGASLNLIFSGQAVNKRPRGKGGAK